MLHNNILRFSLCFKRQISYFYISINVKTTVKRTWCSSFELCVSPYVYIKRLEKFYKLTTKIRFVWMSSPYKFIYIYILLLWVWICCCYNFNTILCSVSRTSHSWKQPKFRGAHLGIAQVLWCIALYMAFRKWFMAWLAPSSYGCTQDVGRARNKRKSWSRRQPRERETLDVLVFSQLPKCIHRRRSTPNHELFLLLHKIRHKRTENKSGCIFCLHFVV